MEPRKDQKPTIRRRGKGKRRIEPNMKGRIDTYFSKLVCTKEWANVKTTEGGAFGHGPEGMRKRKLQSLLEDPERCPDSNPRRLRVMEPVQTDVEINSRTLSPSILGARSKDGREPGQGQVVGATTGLDLMVKNKESVWKLPGEFDKTETKLYK